MAEIFLYRADTVKMNSNFDFEAWEMDPKLTWKQLFNAKPGGGWAGPAATKKLLFVLIWMQKTLLLNVRVKNTQ